ncbi:SPOR domain-containing protein [Parvibaculum sp.]|uniref:SPOR domain-containing protein n=1 Tax=Parvibaculum sp. TaxID=2024848 RepID=UPI003BAB0C9F
MAKKPASLTSDLLARKGEAGPSSVDPVSRVTIAPGRQPNLSGIGVNEGPSPGLYGSPATERPEMHAADEDERPQPPEPEIIYTPEEEDSGSRTRLIAGAFVGLALLGGVVIALSLNDGGSGVAPVSPDVTAMPDEAPAQQQVAEAPAAQAPAASEDANPEAAVPGEAPDAPTETPELRASAEPAAPEPEAAPAETKAAVESAAESSGESAGAPTSIAPPAARPEAQPPAQSTAESKAEEPAATAPAAASGGAYVVQIMALREEGAAQTAWASLQKKHPSVLGGHALDIEKADLGDKGTFYRIRAAGFETKAAAQSACSSLKAAGQDCLVKSR